MYARKENIAERTKVLKSDEVRKQYFLIYEGSETEVIYFDAVRSLRGDIGINPLIELIPLIRSLVRMDGAIRRKYWIG